MTTYLVTGTSGHLGRLVVRSLLDLGVSPADVVATARDTDAVADLAALGVVVRRADYTDPASLAAAFAGVDRALLVSSNAVGRAGRAPRRTSSRPPRDAGRRAARLHQHHPRRHLPHAPRRGPRRHREAARRRRAADRPAAQLVVPRELHRPAVHRPRARRRPRRCRRRSGQRRHARRLRRRGRRRAGRRRPGRSGPRAGRRRRVHPGGVRRLAGRGVRDPRGLPRPPRRRSTPRRWSPPACRRGSPPCSPTPTSASPVASCTPTRATSPASSAVRPPRRPRRSAPRWREQSRSISGHGPPILAPMPGRTAVRRSTRPARLHRAPRAREPGRSRPAPGPRARRGTARGRGRHGRGHLHRRAQPEGAEASSDGPGHPTCTPCSTRARAPSTPAPSTS